MAVVLRTTDDELRDLAEGSPELVDACNGERTGVRLVRWLGAGGMAGVLLGECAPSGCSKAISPLAPRHLAIKFHRLSTERQLARMGLQGNELFRKELIALGRVMERKPPTEFVVGLYGSGLADVQVNGKETRRLPWLALEYVDGGGDGGTLSSRVQRAQGGLDPVRALRLVRGMVEGVGVLHESGVLHRDLKPDNVFVAGPVDDETPKIADCGIARVEGLRFGTIAALTPAYGGPEQMLSVLQPTQSNPLIGPWTDVHALGAIVWFALAGEQWCRGDSDPAWHTGARRSLRTAARPHPAFVAGTHDSERLDAVLGRATSHRLPRAAWAAPGAKDYDGLARLRFEGSMFQGAERYASLAELAAALLPLLERSAQQWTSRAAKQNVASTVSRPTRFPAAEHVDRGLPLAAIEEFAPGAIAGTGPALGDKSAPPIERGNAVFRADGRALGRFGERLVYFIDGRPHNVSVPSELRMLVRSTCWLGRGPGGGFALVGASHVLLVRGGQFVALDLPKRPSGGMVGPIQAVIADGRAFGIVTAETDDSEGGPELWLCSDGATWSSPQVLPLGGDAHAAAAGPFGVLVVGSRQGKRARALHLGLDGHATVFTAGVNDKPPLRLALAGAQRDFWAAGDDILLCISPAGAVEEKREAHDAPVAMALDLVGLPWLVTEHAVLRRQVLAGTAVWKAYYRRGPDRPKLVGLGFTAEHAVAMDDRGGGALIRPHDIDAWCPTALV